VRNQHAQALADVSRVCKYQAPVFLCSTTPYETQGKFWHDFAAALYGLLNKCVINVPKHWQTADFKGFVDALGIKYQALKKQRGAIIGFLTFESVAQMEAAVPVLLSQTLRGTALKVSEARARPWELRAMANGGLVGTVNPPPQKDEARGESTGLETGPMENGAQGGMEESTANGAETGRGDDIQGNGVDDVSRKGGGAYDSDIRKDIRDAVTPWWRIEYPQQLEQKEAAIAQLLKRLVRFCPSSTALFCVG
jgi:hypothetical protein